jgi:hypothetical protein
MMRVDVTRMPTSAALRLGLLAGFLAAAGCSSSPAGSKGDEPGVKGSLQKSMDMYKAKSHQVKKGSPVAASKRPH